MNVAKVERNPTKYKAGVESDVAVWEIFLLRSA